MCICHILFIHSSVDGRVDCFHLLAIVNNAVMDTGVHVSEFLLSVLLGICPRVKLPGHMVILCLTF